MRFLLLTVCLLALSSFAAADTFQFTYSGGEDLASGILFATPNGDGSFTALSGSGQFDGFSITLMANPNGTSNATSPGGYFVYDNQLFPGQDPLLNSNGLLFSMQDGNATELNIYGNGACQSYTAETHVESYNYSNGTFDASAVPEPATLPLVLGGSLVLGLACHLRRRVVKE
jgi:hypothetical protein